jgi:hypothetical protein
MISPTRTSMDKAGEEGRRLQPSPTGPRLGDQTRRGMQGAEEEPHRCTSQDEQSATRQGMETPQRKVLETSSIRE